jgi:hypothetical protein
MNPQKTLLDFVLDPVESDRVAAVADLLAQAENQTRRAALLLAGVESANKENCHLARDLALAQGAIQELSVWLTAHWHAIYSHIEPAPIVAEEPPEESRVIH